MRRKKLTAIDLFSGCGGLTEGLKQGGFRVIGAVEIDRLAVNTYKANHRGVRVWHKDIRDLTASELLRDLALKPGELDLLAGCPPCQGFSTMRSLNGKLSVADQRNNLIYQFLRLVRELRPKGVMLENVPGLRDDARFARFVSELGKLGYRHINAGVHDARYYGVPQRRRRLIVVATKQRAVEFPELDADLRTVRQSIGGLPKAGASGDAAHDLPEKRSPAVKALIARIPKNGGSRSDLPASDQLECHKRTDGFYDVYGRMSWDDVSPTITGGCFNPSKGRFLHPTKNRCITMREAALLQSFPRDYRFPDVTNKEALALLIGNALPPEMIRRFALATRDALQAA